ncbi:MAG: hypothetical protein QW134_07420, partial [Nitrososphaeria archaeon]
LDYAIVAYILPQLEYFMPRLRKSKLFKEEEEGDNKSVDKNSWSKIKEAINGFNLPRTLQKFEEAEKEFKVI